MTHLPHDLIYVYSFSKDISFLYELYQNDIFKQKDDEILLKKILNFDCRIFAYDNQVILLD